MGKKQVFFSFEFAKDCSRAGQVRNMGVVDSSSTFSDNDWEEVKVKSDSEIKKWIDSQLEKRSVLVVLIGATTANRKWINYEIEKAYSMGKGLVGVYIHGLKNLSGEQAKKGSNPFRYIEADDSKALSNYVECFDSSYSTSKNVYNDIAENLEDLIERANEKRGTY